MRLLLPLCLVLTAPLSLPLAQSSAAVRGPAPERPAPKDLITIDLRLTGIGIRDLLREDYDVAAMRPGGRIVEVLATDEDQLRLRMAGIPFDVVQESLASFLEARLAGAQLDVDPQALQSPLDPPFGQGSMGGYYTLDEVLSVLDQLTDAHPEIATSRASIGQSLEGRDLWMIKVSDNPQIDENEPEVRFDALHHAREPQSLHTVLWFLKHVLENYGRDPEITWLVDNRELYFIPVVNPDGYVYNESTNPGGGGLWRKNRRNNGGSFGVDLNRNYTFQWGFDDVGSSPTASSETYRGSSPASEPETQAMEAFMAARNFETALTCHSYSNLWLYPWGYTTLTPSNVADYIEVSNLATEVNGYTVQQAIDLYPTNGTTDDHDHGAHGTMSWTPEIGNSADNFWPPQSRILPLARENVLACLRTAHAAGSWARLAGNTLSEVGDGDGSYEAGETVEFRTVIRNSGRHATASNVVVQLSTSSALATVGTSSVDLGSLSSFSQADHNASPLTLVIEPGTADGSLIPWTLTVSYDGRVLQASGQLLTGAPVIAFDDDAESDQGWTLGLGSDGAATGLWVRDDPIGTTSGGDVVQPEDDTTPGAGTQCFVTGNGSTSAGGDDVDGGPTTLLSPVLDLSAYSAARVSYDRWFVDLTAADDVLQVSVSNDGGSSWVVVENLSTNQTSWERSSWILNDFVTPTNQVQLRFVASDNPNNSLYEAAVDEVLVEGWVAPPLVAAPPAAREASGRGAADRR